jgi:nucleoside-diphosphate-sugar epimerase
MGKELYLVTGGAGFIGSNIVQLLLDRGRRVRVLDNFSTGRRENLKAFAADVDLVEGDIRDPRAVKGALAGVSFVSHQAALPSVARSVEDPFTSNQVNVDGALTVLLAARDAGVKRLVFASSSSVYGNNPVLPKREDMLPAPLSPYAVGKLTGEHYCAVFSRLFGLPCVALRYFNVFGPRQDPRSQYAAVIPNFFGALCEGKAPLIDGDGEQSRDFTYVRNVAEANLRVLDAPLEGGEVMNIACGEAVTVNALYGLIGETLGVSIPPRRGAPRQGDVRHSLADVSRAKEVLGFTPAIGLKEGLLLTAGYYREMYRPAG